MKKLLKQLLSFRRILLPLSYASLLAACLSLAFLLRFDFSLPESYKDQLVVALLWIIPVKLLILLAFRQFSGHLTVFSIPDFARLVFALAGGSAAILIVRNSNDLFLVPPRSITSIDFALSLVALGGMRLGLRLAWERLRASEGASRKTCQRRVGIVGAGDVGSNLARELLIKRHLGLDPVVIFDDDRDTWRSRVHGIPVVGPPEILLCRNGDAGSATTATRPRFFEGFWHSRFQGLCLDEVIIAMPSAPVRRIREVVEILQRAGIKFRTIPSVDQVATGAVNLNQLREVEIQDLLGRDPIRIETENIREVLEGKTIMVTGAGGSIGSELCKQILGFHPKRLLLVEQCEVQMFQIEQQLIARGHAASIQPCIANVLDSERMNLIFERHRPQIVFHAAAHKHVPLMENHPGESIKNNTLGTAHVARLSSKYQVERFVLISTDKAINPTNVMGATKRLAEMFIQALHAASTHGTKLMGVRFGNVLGSSGSVIPTFSKQIAAGGPVKVTHPEITRYFMTIPEAVSLVLQSCAQGQGGEIFVLDMGKPVRILDLANEMIRLSGFKPGEDIEIEFIGLRPGEKLYEELSSQGENITPTLHPKIMRFVSPLPRLEEMTATLDDLAKHLHTMPSNELKLRLQRIIPEYRPHLVPAPIAFSPEILKTPQPIPA